MQGLCPLNVPSNFPKNSAYLAYLKGFALDPGMKKARNFIFMWWVIIFMVKSKGWGNKGILVSVEKKNINWRFAVSIESCLFQSGLYNKRNMSNQANSLSSRIHAKTPSHPLLPLEWEVTSGPKMIHQDRTFCLSMWLRRRMCAREGTEVPAASRQVRGWGPNSPCMSKSCVGHPHITLHILLR